MKSFAVALAILASLSLLVVPSESAIEDVAEAVPAEILKSLANSSGLVKYSYVDNYPSTNYTFNVSSTGGFLVGTNSSVNVTVFGPSLVRVVFDLVLPDVTLDGKLVTQSRDDKNVTRRAGFRAVAMGNLTLNVDSFFNIKTETLVVKNDLKRRVNFFTDFLWSNCKPLQWDCIQAENKVKNYLTTTFPYTYNDRIHDVIYEASPEIAKRISKSISEDGFFLHH